MKKDFLFFLFSIVIQFTYGQIKNENILEFKEVASEKFLLIDVRTPEEYAQGHIGVATNYRCEKQKFCFWYSVYR